MNATDLNTRGPQTITSWKVTEYSGSFRSRHPGRDLFTGIEFGEGTMVKRVVLAGGRIGYVVQDGNWDIRIDNDGTFYTNYCFDMAKLDAFLARPDIKDIYLCTREGKRNVTAYRRNQDGTFSRGFYRGTVSAKQFLAHARRSFAFLASA